MASVEVNFRNKTAIVSMSQGQTINQAAVEEALKETGYEVTSFEELPAGAEEKSRKQSGS